jgi:hypothetical protein
MENQSLTQIRQIFPQSRIKKMKWKQDEKGLEQEKVKGGEEEEKDRKEGTCP